MLINTTDATNHEEEEEIMQGDQTRFILALFIYWNFLGGLIQ